MANDLISAFAQWLAGQGFPRQPVDPFPEETGPSALPYGRIQRQIPIEQLPYDIPLVNTISSGQKIPSTNFGTFPQSAMNSQAIQGLAPTGARAAQKPTSSALPTSAGTLNPLENFIRSVLNAFMPRPTVDAYSQPEIPNKELPLWKRIQAP